MIFRVDTVVLAYHHVDVEVCIDHLLCGVCIAGAWQDHIAITAEKISCPVILTDVNSKPSISPEIAHLVFFRNPGVRPPTHFRACRCPDDKVLITSRYMVAMPTGPLAAVYQNFPNVGR